MIDETLRRLEERIRASKRTSDATRQELLTLVGELRVEIGQLARSHAEDAGALAEHAAAAVDDEPTAVEERVRELEAAHPRVAALVRSFMQTLSDAGI